MSSTISREVTRAVAFSTVMVFSFLPTLLAADAEAALGPGMEQFETADTVILAGLHRVDEIPPSAIESVLPAEYRSAHKRKIRVDVSEDTPVGSAEWWEASFVTVEDAERTVLFIDENEQKKEFVSIQAGYEYPTSPDETRQPWLVVTRTGRSTPARCDFVISPSESHDSGLDLREVVAIDHRHIYLTAVSPEGEEHLVGATYTFASDNAKRSRARRVAPARNP